MFLADLHVHSRFSRACSKNCDIPGLAWWALRKGVTVAGTGDFTHPAWAAELRDQLVPAEPGLLRLRPDLEAEVRRTTARSCGQQVRFLLSAEISTIYRRGDRTRKVHHLLYAPTFDAAERITDALARIGNLASDGRPILGLDSRDLLEITLSGGPGCFLIPAHIWTPWFAVLGSKSGFDTVAECYADLAGHVFAIETGLSSDPPMNWSCSFLDSYRLVSNSDAHSPPMLGREATEFSTELDYFAMAGALRTGAGLEGTINFYPEGGRYHLDGHRKCGVRCEPAESRSLGGNCPGCGKPLTIGVLHRVAELADRPAGHRPPGAAGYANLVSLAEILGEIRGVGPKSKQVGTEAARLVSALGPELAILREIPADEIARAGGSLLGEAVARLRRGEVTREAGYDGEYGVVRVFRSGELTRAGTLFEVPAPRPAAEPRAAAAALAATGAAAGETAPAEGGGRPDGAGGPAAAADSGRSRRGDMDGPDRDAADRHAADQHAADQAGGTGTGTDGAAAGTILAGLDPDQRAAAAAPAPLIIVAGPGTGKTRTLTHRIAAAVAERGVPPERCLAITFTRRAAQELRDRLAALLPGRAAAVTVTTFHGLGLAILRGNPGLAGLSPDFTVAGEETVREVAAEVAGSERAAGQLLSPADPAGRELLTKALAARDLVSFEGLLDLPLQLLRASPELTARLRERWPVLSVDEYQDVDARQYELLRLLAGDGRGLTVIGDPDQAIYGFRGSDVRFFQRFSHDYPGAAAAVLTRNYRSAPAILGGAQQAVAPATLVPGRILRPATAGPAAGGGGQEWPPSARITLHEAADEHAEAAWIGQAVDRLLGGASFHSLDSGRADGYAAGGLTLASIAVLYRTDAQAGPLGQGLTRAGLPWQKRSHDRLGRRAAVPEVAGELRLAGPDGTAGAPVTTRLQAAVRTLADQAPLRGLAAVDVLAAGEVLAPLARRCGSDLERFLTEIALGAEADSLDPRADAITLLTLHAAKGLEFDVVFLAGCERGLLPLRLPGAAPADGDLAEERRLLFVGMTRARRHLFLTCAATRRRHGATLPGGPSPFLASISPALLDRAAHARPRRPAARQLKLL